MEKKTEEGEDEMERPLWERILLQELSRESKYFTKMQKQQLRGTQKALKNSPRPHRRPPLPNPLTNLPPLKKKGSLRGGISRSP
eukprot:283426-Amorphochlora_amoeboformis.AAC.2